MTIAEFFASFFNRPSKWSLIEENEKTVAANYYIRELAFWSAVRIVSNAVSSTEARTYVKNKETFGDEYYLLNIRPNRNQNSTEFYQEMIRKLYYKNEVLIIESPLSKDLLIADTYEKTDKAVIDTIFEKVKVNDFEFEKSFFMQEVLFLKLNNTKIKKLLDSMNDAYSKMIDVGLKSYTRSRGKKGILHLGTFSGRTEAERLKEQEMLNNRFKTVFEAENGIVPLEKGFEYKDLSDSTKFVESSRDIRAMITDVYDLTAEAFGIPPALMHGVVAGNKDLTEYLLTFAVNPIVNMIETEMNHKRYGKTAFLQGTKVEYDTSRIKNIDLLSMAANGDKLISNGFYSVNEVRRKLKEPEINEEWAKKHYITKNYSEAAELGKENSNE